MTTNALAPQDQPTRQEEISEPKALTRIEAHPFEQAAPTPMPSEREFEGLMKMAETLATSGFLPAKLNTAGKVLAVILTGRELGLPPMLSTRSIRLVDGNPVISADVLLGAFKRPSVGGRASFVALSDKIATIWLRHPNGDEHTESFTIAMAATAKLLDKDNWKKYPQAMLRSRVITAGLKSLGWEPAAGVYNADEAEEIEAARGIVTSVTATVSASGEVESVDNNDEGSQAVDEPITIRGKRLDEKKAKGDGGGYALGTSALKGSIMEWAQGKLNATNVESEMKHYQRMLDAINSEIMRRQGEDAAALRALEEEETGVKREPRTVEEAYNEEKARRLRELKNTEPRPNSADESEKRAEKAGL